ncbi:hypothetical protein HYH03_005017 [Edaphochlamys debaryana]|uniref:Uncharacterized protein n=1 Tax=Edaphochlamys debaryana TaxID=47281 RepID=A0A835YG63_9CHLO|nr:hypothetical protein HYH03_005017 [Edaphochlamys debaryana]|eukprot:KAG2497014.1 hypothetical protein HYH03_005017 [Edaphochlamys debaryana]
MELGLAVVKGEVLSAYAPVLHSAAGALLAQRAHASRRLLQTSKTLAEEFGLIAIYITDGLALATGALAGALREVVAAALDAGVLEHWARLVLALASCEGGEALAASCGEHSCAFLPQLLAAHGTGLFAGPCLAYLLSSHLTLLASSLDAGPTYGLVLPRGNSGSRSGARSGSGSGAGSSEEQQQAPVVGLTWHPEDPSQRRPRGLPEPRAPKLLFARAAVDVWCSALAALGEALEAGAEEARVLPAAQPAPLWSPRRFVGQALRRRRERLDALIAALEGQAARQEQGADQAQAAQQEAAQPAHPAPASPPVPPPPAPAATVAAAAPPHTDVNLDSASSLISRLRRQRAACERLSARQAACPLLDPAPAFELGMRLSSAPVGPKGLDGADLHRRRHWQDTPAQPQPRPADAEQRSSPGASAQLRPADFAFGAVKGMRLARAALKPLLAAYDGPGGGRGAAGDPWPCPDWVVRRLRTWWIKILMFAQPKLLRAEPSALELLRLRHIPGTRLPPGPCADVRAARSADYLTALESLLRAPGALANPAMLDLFPPPNGRVGVWAELLVFCKAPDATSFVATVAKLTRKCCADVVAGPLDEAGGLLLSCAQVAAHAFYLGLGGGLSRALVCRAAPSAGGAPGDGDGGASGSGGGCLGPGVGEAGSPVPEEAIPVASFIAARLLPEAGAALRGLLAVGPAGPAEAAAACAPSGAGASAALDRSWRVSAVAHLSSLLVSWLPSLLAAAQAEGPPPSLATPGAADSGAAAGAGGWWGVFLRDVGYGWVLWAALRSLQRQDGAPEAGAGAGSDGTALKAALWALVARAPELLALAVEQGEAYALNRGAAAATGAAAAAGSGGGRGPGSAAGAAAGSALAVGPGPTRPLLRAVLGPGGRLPEPALLAAVEAACSVPEGRERGCCGRAAGPFRPTAESEPDPGSGSGSGPCGSGPCGSGSCGSGSGPAVLHETASGACMDLRGYKHGTSLLLPHAQALALLPLCANPCCVRLKGATESAAAPDPALGGCCSGACRRELTSRAAASASSAGAATAAAAPGSGSSAQAAAAAGSGSSAWAAAAAAGAAASGSSPGAARPVAAAPASCGAVGGSAAAPAAAVTAVRAAGASAPGTLAAAAVAAGGPGVAAVAGPERAASAEHERPRPELPGADSTASASGAAQPVAAEEVTALLRSQPDGKMLFLEYMRQLDRRHVSINNPELRARLRAAFRNLTMSLCCSCKNEQGELMITLRDA